MTTNNANAVAAQAKKTLRQQRADIAGKTLIRDWVEPDETGFVAALESEVDATIVERLLDTAQQKAVNRRILSAATRAQIIDAASQEFSYGVFLDWRGRLYTNGCGLAPQGKDAGRGVIMAAEPVRLGVEGLHHLAVGVATTWGQDGIDKAHPDVRAQWTRDRVADGWLAAVVAGAQDGSSYEWRLAEEPVQFLALAAEFLTADGNPDFESAVFVGYDATCSGVQILAALGKCPVTASLVNVLPLPNGERADVYMSSAAALGDIIKRVAGTQDDAAAALAIADKTIKASDGCWAVYWRERMTQEGGKLPRSWLKKPVMVANYGGTKRTFAASFREDTRAPWKACLWLAARLYDDVLAELMPTAKAIMEWLQDVAGTLADHGKPLAFTAADGLPFEQAVMEADKHQLNIELPSNGKRIQPVIYEHKDSLDKARQKTGSAPNVVHHFDGLFLRNAVRALVAAGITSFFTVHDCFYLRAGDWAKGWDILRRTFRDTFAGDVLVDLHRAIENKANEGMDGVARVVLPPPPPVGNLDLNAVLGSVFLFS